MKTVSIILASLLLLLVSSLSDKTAMADVVKPALVEINVNQHRQVTIELRASIEALLTGINAQYKNTQEAPTAEEYDVFRRMSAEQLHKAFDTFRSTLLEHIRLSANGDVVDLVVDKVVVPPRGYTKVPRISVITLKGVLPAQANTVQWYYPAKFGDNAVRVKQHDSENDAWHWSQWQWLRKDQPSELFSLNEIVAKKSLGEVIASYVVIGYEHIVPKGLDHILFIVGLFLLSTRWSPLLWQVTMFTMAHTLTLGLAMNNIVELPANIVEPLIALSIAYVGVENIVASHLHRSRLVLVFLFGLLHGLGFAGVLSDFGMPADDFMTALISFNVGVELGQISVLMVAYLALRVWFKDLAVYRRYVVIPGSMFISVVGLFWFLERLELF